MDNIPPQILYSFNDNDGDNNINNDNNDNNNPFDIPHRIDQDMVAAPTSSQLPPSNPTSRDANVAKRYRPAPAKTFQCRGYGDCHMVFSRSEHLARHIRKHTGERPFTCHCGKQFSRLDNLRQHAQTVHSDKQEENERMMRDLTALHTSMTAAHKAANARGKRAQQQHHQQQQQQHASTSASSAGAVTTSANAAAAGTAAAQIGMGGMNNGVKVEELQMHRSLSSANNYGLGSSILQEQTILRPALTSLDLDPTMHRSSYSYSPDSTSTSTSSACQGFPPTPPITPPTAIPFVTPISPFGVQQQQQQQQQQHLQYSHPNQPARSTSTGSNSSSNHSNMPPASPFLPPSPFSPPPQSSHPGARHPLVVGHPLQVVPTQAQQYRQQQQQQQLFVPHSRPSIPLSPNPSPHQAGSLAYFNYPPAQQGPVPQGDREPHRQPTHISPTGLLSGPPDDQQQQLQLLGADWGLSQSFPYTEAPQSWEDQVSQHRRTSSPASVSESMLTQATHRARQTGMARAQTTVPFHSTLPRSATPVHQQQQQQQQQQAHLGYASGHTAGPSPTMTTTGGVTGVMAPAVGSATTTTTTGSMMSHHPGAAPERRLGPHPHPPPPPVSGTPSNSTTGAGPGPGPEAGLSLDGSPSWSSAMTPTLQGALFYPYQHPPDQPPHLAGSSSHRPVQQPHLPSRTQQQQQYLSRQSQHHPPPPPQLQRRQSHQQQQQQQREQEEAAARQADLQAGAAPSHMGSIAGLEGLEGLEEDYIQQYVAMAQAQAQAAQQQQQQQQQQQAYYLAPANNNSNSTSNGLHPRGHPFRTDEGAPHQQRRGGPGAAGQAHRPTPTSASTTAPYNNNNSNSNSNSSNSPPLHPPPPPPQPLPPSAIKYESPSLRAGALQLLPESGCE